MRRITYEEVSMEIFIKFREWLIEKGNHCGYLRYNGDSYRGSLVFEMNFGKDHKDDFLYGVEYLGKLVNEYYSMYRKIK